MIRTIISSPSVIFKREKLPAPGVIAVSVLVYFFGALGIHAVDPVFLLAAWLAGGLMLLTIFPTFQLPAAPFSSYTAFFALVVIGSIAGYFLTEIWK